MTESIDAKVARLMEMAWRFRRMAEDDLTTAERIFITALRTEFAALASSTQPIGEGFFLSDGTWTGSASKSFGYLRPTDEDAKAGCTIRPIYASAQPSAVVQEPVAIPEALIDALRDRMGLTAVQAEPVYFIRPGGPRDEHDSNWKEASEDAFNLTPALWRRKLYTHPPTVGAVEPTAQPLSASEQMIERLAAAPPPEAGEAIEALRQAEIGLSALIECQPPGAIPSTHKFGQARRALKAVRKVLTLKE